MIEVPLGRRRSTPLAVVGTCVWRTETGKRLTSRTTPNNRGDGASVRRREKGRRTKGRVGGSSVIPIQSTVLAPDRLTAGCFYGCYLRRETRQTAAITHAYRTQDLSSTRRNQQSDHGHRLADNRATRRRSRRQTSFAPGGRNALRPCAPRRLRTIGVRHRLQSVDWWGNEPPRRRGARDSVARRIPCLLNVEASIALGSRMSRAVAVRKCQSSSSKRTFTTIVCRTP